MKAGSALGFGVWALVLGGLGYGVYWFTDRNATEDRLRQELANLTASKRVAKVICHAVEKDTDGRDVVSLRWAELDEDGEVREDIPIRDFTAKGKVVRFEAYQIIFQDSHIREGDPLRGKALSLFKSAYGGSQAPDDGTRLDLPPGVGEKGGKVPELSSSDIVPAAYRVSKNAREATFEKRLWQEFWKLCNDPKFAKSEGVKAVQLTSVGKEMIAGKEYRLTIQRDGQLLIEGPFPTTHKTE